jgi:diaminopimelate epimerase
MEINFFKLHGNGNDFILIDEMEGPVIPDDLKADFASLYCDRRFGIGADGVLYLLPSETSDLRMRLFQPDKSEAEMCGNGIRCLAKYAHDTGYVQGTCTVETPAGEMRVEMAYDEAENFTAVIDMVSPVFARAGIPASGEGEFIEEIGGYTVYAVNTGVPHAVIFVEEIGEIAIETLGPLVRNHPVFPEGANVNFVEVAGENELHIRTFERGIEGETESCGTGATAAAAVAHHLGYAGEPKKEYMGETIRVMTRGGPLTIHLGDGGARMEGPATTVYAGVIVL